MAFGFSVAQAQYLTQAASEFNKLNKQISKYGYTTWEVTVDSHTRKPKVILHRESNNKYAPEFIEIDTSKNKIPMARWEMGTQEFNLMMAEVTFERLTNMCKILKQYDYSNMVAYSTADARKQLR